MKWRGIIFTGWSVRQILADFKTQTRRVMKPQPPEGAEVHAIGAAGNWWLCKDGKPLGPWRCPYGVPGDGLWARETWRYADWTEDGYPYIEYRADASRRLCEKIPEEWDDRVSYAWAELSRRDNYQIDNCAADHSWRPSIFMPRWASRLTLELMKVRVQRLQDISAQDARAEGIVGDIDYAVGRFADLWYSLHVKPKPAKRNPYTWEPERCKVAYPWDDMRETSMDPRKSSPYHGCKTYTVGNPHVWPLTFKRIGEDI